MFSFKRKLIAVLLSISVAVRPTPSKADFWGGDIPLLIQIVANTLQQLVQLKSILGNGRETLSYVKDINAGIRNALNLIRTQNTTLSPGVLSDLDNVQQILNTVERLYGMVPQTAEASQQRTVDQTVAEAIQLHNEAFKYADRVDPEGERIKEYSKFVSPLGAERLTAQSMGVLINLMNQLLRTNAAILKLQSQNLAIENRSNKLESEHFKIQYEGLSKAFSDLKPSYQLPSLSGS